MKNYFTCLCDTGNCEMAFWQWLQKKQFSKQAEVMTREGHKEAFECGQWKVTSDFLILQIFECLPFSSTTDFFQNMAYKIGDNLSTL